jgi:hypothetical protein
MTGSALAKRRYDSKIMEIGVEVASKPEVGYVPFQLMTYSFLTM